MSVAAEVMTRGLQQVRAVVLYLCPVLVGDAIVQTMMQETWHSAQHRCQV